MDFHSLPRKDLQFFCKKNQIPANMTNLAMADALKALEIVEGIEEFANQSPTSVAKNLPSAARTAARRKTETQPSELVTRSCYVTSKSLAGETDQENRHTLNVIPQSHRRAAVAMNLEEDTTDMKPETKTPAARSTRRTQQAASSKKDESIQPVYSTRSTRRSVKLLEESMADLCLKTATKKKNEADSKTEEEVEEVVSVRDLSASMEKEWDSSSGMKNDPDLDVLYGDLGDITFSDANMNAIESNTDSFVVVEEEHETLKEDDFIVVNQETESEQIKNESESETDDADDSGVVAESNQVTFESKVDSVTTVLVADESKEVESDNDSEESKKKPEEEEEDESEWSEFEYNSESEEALVSDKKTPLSSFEAESISEPNKSAQKLALVADNENKEEIVEEMLVIDNNGEEKSEAETEAKKKSDEERFKDVSMRQLTKMVKELAIKSQQRPQHKYI